MEKNRQKMVENSVMIFRSRQRGCLPQFTAAGDSPRMFSLAWSRYFIKVSSFSYARSHSGVRLGV